MDKSSKKRSLTNWRRDYPLLFNAAMIVVAVGALSLAAHLAMQAGTRHSARRTVPDMTGMPYELALREASARNLKLHINDSLFVPAYDGGVVLDQLPEGGTEVKPGRTIYLTINSYRQKSVEVPYVAGRSLRQAKNMLEIAGLEIAELVYRPDMATNFVLEQWCNGHKMERGDRVEMEMGSGVTLCVGAEDDVMTVVPKIVGLSLESAKSRLWETGLNVGAVNFDKGIDRLNRDRAQVCTQSITAGLKQPLGTRVSLELTLDSVRVAKAGKAADEALQRIIDLMKDGDDGEFEGVDSLLLQEIM